MSDHREASTYATAALVNLIARGQTVQAAIISGAPAKEVERLRQEAMAVAETYLDHTIEAARAVRAIIEP